MSEYYDALASAVANLKPADQAARYTFYDRARKLVLQRLQAVDPPMADADIRTEMNAFNAAIRQLETDIARPRRAPAPPKQAPAPPVAPARRETPAARKEPSNVAAPPHAPSPASSLEIPHELEIPREFVGAAPMEPEPEMVSASLADDAVGPPAPDAAPAVAPPDGSLRRLGIVIGVALVAGVLAAAAYALWGRQTPPRTAAVRPAAPAASLAPQARITPRNPERLTADADNMPYILRRQLVYYRTNHPPGTLVISKSQNFLYAVRPNSTAMRYTVGMGPDTSDASGLYQISRKDSAADGLYLGDSKFRIRQSNAPITIGRPASAPGFQLVADDFGDLYDHIDLGTRVVVTN